MAETLKMRFTNPDGSVEILPVPKEDLEEALSYGGIPVRGSETMFGQPRVGTTMKNVKEFGVGSLPAVGGIGGGIVGGLIGGVPGAAAFGATGAAMGESARQALQEPDLPMAGRANKVLSEAVLGSMAGGTGKAAQTAGQWAGRGVYGMGIRPTPLQSREMLTPFWRRMYPEGVPNPLWKRMLGGGERQAVDPSLARKLTQQEMVKRGVVSGGTKGSTSTSAEMKKLGAELDKLIAEAEKRGEGVSLRAIIDGVEKYRRNTIKVLTDMYGNEDKAIKRINKDAQATIENLIAKSEGGMISPSEAQNLKRIYQNQAKRIFKMEAKGVPVTEKAVAKASGARETSRVLKDELEDFGVGPLNDRISQLGNEKILQETAESIAGGPGMGSSSWLAFFPPAMTTRLGVGIDRFSRTLPAIPHGMNLSLPRGPQYEPLIPVLPSEFWATDKESDR